MHQLADVTRHKIMSVVADETCALEMVTGLQDQEIAAEKHSLVSPSCKHQYQHWMDIKELMSSKRRLAKLTKAERCVSGKITYFALIANTENIYRQVTSINTIQSREQHLIIQEQDQVIKVLHIDNCIMYVSLYSSSVITIIIYLLEMVIKNSSQYVYAVEQDKKAQSALTIALKTHTIHVIHVGLQCI